jgi:hypothetical protein
MTDKKNIHTQMALCEFEKVIKDAENPMFKKGRPNYSTLGAIHDVVRPELKRHGLYYSAFETIEQHGFLCVRITHAESETYIETYVKLLNMSDMQKYVGSTTYARKNGISTLCGLYAEDDDGNSISSTNDSKPTKPTESIQLTLIDRSKITFNLHELWKMKEGVVRAQETVASMKAINMFKDDFVGVPDDALIKLRDWIASL